MAAVFGAIYVLIGLFMFINAVLTRTETAMHQIFVATGGVTGALFFVGGSIMIAMWSAGARRREADQTLLKAIEALAAKPAERPIIVQPPAPAASIADAGGARERGVASRVVMCTSCGRQSPRGTLVCDCGMALVTM